MHTDDVLVADLLSDKPSTAPFYESGLVHRSAARVVVLGADPLVIAAIASSIHAAHRPVATTSVHEAIANVLDGYLSALVLLPRSLNLEGFVAALRKSPHTKLILAGSNAGPIPPDWSWLNPTFAQSLEQLQSALPPVQQTEQRLTNRQLQILQSIAHGRSLTETADDLSISVKTLNNHLGSVYQRLQVRNITQATLYAVRHHLINF